MEVLRTVELTPRYQKLPDAPPGATHVVVRIIPGPYHTPSPACFYTLEQAKSWQEGEWGGDLITAASFTVEYIGGLEDPGGPDP